MKYEIKMSRRKGEYRAYIIGDNSKTIWVTPDTYKRIAGAEKAIRLIDKETPIDVFDRNGNWVKVIAPQIYESPVVNMEDEVDIIEK